MPVQWLTEIERDLLGQWPETVTDADLAAHFTLTDVDRELVAQRRGDDNRLGFAVALCALRFLGFFPASLQGVPGTALRFLAHQLTIEPGVLVDYGRNSRTRSDHEQQAVLALGFRRTTTDDRYDLFVWLTDRAMEHDRPLLLLNVLIERLRQMKLLRPGISLLERDVSAARREAEVRTWRAVESWLTPELRVRLNGLVKTQTPHGRSPLAWIGAGAVASKSKSIKETLDKIDRIREIGVENWDLSAFHPNRIKLLARFASYASNQRLERMPDETRFPTLIAFLVETLAELLDTVMDQFDRFLADIQHNAERDFEDLRQSAARTGQERNRLLGQVARVLLNGEIPDPEVRESVFGVVPRELLMRAVAQCEVEQRPRNEWPADLIAAKFGVLRQFSRRFLVSFTWRSSPDYVPLLRAIKVVVKTWGDGKARMPESPPREFIPEKWLRWVFPEGKTANQKYYELCVLWELRLALRSGNVWVEGARRYRDPSSFLIPPDRWLKTRSEVRKQLNLTQTADAHLASLGHELAAVVVEMDAALKLGKEVSLDEDGVLSLARLDADEEPGSVESLRTFIDDRLPLVDLSELLLEVEGWTNVSACFTHIANYHRPSREDLPLLFAALMAHGGNFGIAGIAHMTKLPEQSIRTFADAHLRLETIKAAYSHLANAFHRHPLAKTWGNGTLSSSDGQRFRTQGKTLTATANPKYFGYGQGITAYTWTSDQFVQYGTKVIPTTLRDATVILDGILDNQTELPIEEHVADTSGYTEVTFALFSLLGLRFSPRIRDLGRQRLYRLGDLPKSPARTLLKGKINTDLIKRHWDDLLRLTGSLKGGWVPASLLVSRLQAAPRKNPLVRALQEYGRLCKTIFVLKYLSNKTFRRYIQQQLNRGENLNGLRGYLFAGNEAEVRLPMPEDQNDQMSCLTILTNAVLLWNTTYFEELLKQPRVDWPHFNQDDLKYIWPSRFGHVNPYGTITFKVAETLERKGLLPFRVPPKRRENP